MKFHHLLNRFKDVKGIWFHVMGVVAIIWFLVRVVPKPDRYRYPCQQMSLTVALTYIGFWSAMMVGALHWIRTARFQTQKVLAVLLVVGMAIAGFSGAVFGGLISSPSEWDPESNEPLGTPIGFRPGRVVWVWDPDATEEHQTGYWWETQNNNVTVVRTMMSRGLRELTGTMCDFSAWDSLFRWFNEKQGNGFVGYQPGEKIAIKINMNNGYFGGYDTLTEGVDANPYVVKALLYQLIDIVGVAPEDITVFDSSRKLMDWFYNRVYYEEYPADVLVADFEGVHFVDSHGTATGRGQVVASNQSIYFAGEDDFIPTLPTCVTEADYLINMPIAKRHINDRVTLAGKNWFGSWIEDVSNVHPYHEASLTMGELAPQTDLTAHEQLGQKTLLLIGDGTYGCRYGNTYISKFQMYPFNDDWMSSLFFSQDPVAIDSVMWDFFYQEGTGPGEDAHNYLHQSADPPSNSYDPENDGIFINFSLGVHEHANYDLDIFSSSRYVGFSGGGIDYIAVALDDAEPGVQITYPHDHRLYLFGNEAGLFPFVDITIVIGALPVRAEIVGVPMENISSVSFLLDGMVVDTMNEEPFVWEWKRLSFWRHELSVDVMIDDGSSIVSSPRVVWKLL